MPPQRTTASVDLEACALLPQERAVDHKPSVRGRVAVLLALAGMIWATVAQSEASQALQAQAQFNRPFFILCFNHTLTGLLVPCLLLYFRLFGSKTDRYDSAWRDPMRTLYRHSVLPPAKLVAVSWFLSFFFLFVDYFWYAALTGVSITVATTIGNSTPLFVYCFSICALHERVTAQKVGGVLVAFLGVTLVVLFQAPDLSFLQDQHVGVVAGLLVVVQSALCAAYDVALKVLIGVDVTDTATILIVTGLSGVCTIPMWLVGSLLVAHSPFASLYEPLGGPATTDGVGLLFLAGGLAVLTNVCTPLLLCWTSPLETRVGAMLVVPLSGVWDVVFHGTHFSTGCIVGSLLVLLGYGVLEFDPRAVASVASTSTPSTKHEAIVHVKKYSFA